MANASVQTTKTVTLELSEAEADVLQTLVAHVAQNSECYAISSAFERAGIEWSGDSVVPGREDLEYFIEPGTGF